MNFQIIIANSTEVNYTEKYFECGNDFGER